MFTLFLLEYVSLSTKRFNQEVSMMENILKKIPELGKGIFDNLDDENLVQCKEICRSWHAFMDEERF